VDLFFNLINMQYQSGTKVTDGTACLYLNVTAGSAVAKVGMGQLYGATVNSHTSGTLKFLDSAATATASTVINNTITLAAGERYVNLGGVTFTDGLVYVVGGTANVTLHYR
jgi:hypothetical protein